MHTIIKIEGVDEWVKDDKTHFRTHAILEDGSEVVGYGKDFDLGDKVMSWWDEEHQVYKMEKRT